MVIVGHGPSLKGANKGKEIDKHHVVRLKCCEKLLKNPLDYGTRTDYHCSTTETLCEIKGTDPIEYWGYPKHGQFNQYPASVLASRTKKTVWVPAQKIERWNERFRQMGAKHKNISLGLASIIIALERVKPEKLYLAGFDNVLNPDQPYVTEVGRYGGALCKHDWKMENNLLEVIREEYKTEICAL